MKRTLLITALFLGFSVAGFSQTMEKSTGQKGTVILYDSQQGHGFILPDESGKDVFVHQNGLIDEIKEGDVVEFELAEGKKGLNAVNVKLATSFSEGTDQGRRF